MKPYEERCIKDLLQQLPPGIVYHLGNKAARALQQNRAPDLDKRIKLILRWTRINQESQFILEHIPRCFLTAYTTMHLNHGLEGVYYNKSDLMGYIIQEWNDIYKAKQLLYHYQRNR